MILLAVDTATRVCGVALSEDDTVRIEYTADHGQTHARHVLRMIRTVLDEAGCGIDQLDGFCVTVGPGSFTGLRIGLSTVKGLALAADKPVTGVSSLDALAYPFEGADELVCPFVDARKKEVYTALYRWGADGFKIASPPRVTAPDAALSEIDTPCRFVGNGVRLYQEEIISRLGKRAILSSPVHDSIRASVIARLGYRRFLEHGGESPHALFPVYIRRSDAERHLKKQA